MEGVDQPGAARIADRGLAGSGRDRVEWALDEMPVLRGIIESFQRDRPLDGLVIGACLHVTTETANLARALVAGGAEVALCASNPLSTQDDTAAALVEHYGVSVYARRGVDRDGYYEDVRAVLAHGPRITLDDGADLVSEAHRGGGETLDRIFAGTEETTTGVVRLRAMAAEGALKYPVLAVNDADTKHLFDNRYGTGQSALDGVLRATNFLIAGRVFVVGGYGWCGRGIAMRARGLGARVVVTEVDPLRALEATMDGFEVLPMARAVEQADFVVTATGDRDVVAAEHFARMKDGCVVANSGHFDVEVDVNALQALDPEPTEPRPGVRVYRTPDGRRIRLLAEGRLVNLAAAEGHPAAVMDMSFANQALGVAWLVENHASLEPAVHSVPEQVDRAVASRKLAAMGVAIDTLTEAQRAYLGSWRWGT